MITKLIFVCTENTCQSPMAATIFQAMEHKPDIEVCSRGIVVLFPEPVSPKAEQVLAMHGLLMEQHTTRQFQQDEVNQDTLVLTMNIVQKRRLATDFYVNDNVYTLKEYAGGYGDIEDPYGQSIEGYERCYNEIRTLMDRVVYRLLYGKLPE